MSGSVGIIGAGPAGLMAAIHAAREKVSVLVLEANDVAGRKLLLTGGGRCNFAHVGAPEEIARAFDRAGRFLRHSLHQLPPEGIRRFFHDRGLPSTVEPNGCLFPASHRASEILDVLLNEARRLGVRFLYGSPVVNVVADASGLAVCTNRRQLVVSKAIIATGGVSWPQTGSRGDGYRFARGLGHTVVAPRASLVPLVTWEKWPEELAGTSVSNVRIRVLNTNRKDTSVANMLFTQNGIGGPAGQDLSRLLTDELPKEDGGIPVEIDLVPQESEPQLDAHIRQRLQSLARRSIANVLSEWVPRQLSLVLCRLAECDRDVQAGQCRADTRKRLVRLLKHVPLRITGTESIARATVTRGGVRRDEIDPRTLESKIRPGLFFAGEVIDLDGPCGGYNLQMCWSTGAVAGRSAARSLADS